MFLPETYRTWGDEHGQYSQGRYILLFQAQWDLTKASCPQGLRVLVRTAKLSLVDGRMTGLLRLNCPGRELAFGFLLSGAFGNDGLPLVCPARLWEHLHCVPPAIESRFWLETGDYRHSPGASAIFDWAKEQASRLRRLRKHDRNSEH